MSFCVDSLVPPIILTHLLNASYNQVRFLLASKWPCSIIEKKPSVDQNKLKNYHLVSNLPCVSKFLENKWIRAIFLSHKEQHSTESALLRVFNNFTVNAMTNNFNIFCLLDLSFTFDSIDHDNLLIRPEDIFGKKDSALNWFRSYLTVHWKSVVVDSVRSSNHLLNCGVPQGSVLGLILFTLYTCCPLPLTLRNSSRIIFIMQMITIYNSASFENFDNLISRLENCSIDFKHWMLK